jgi:hypothetical protein
MSSGYNPFTLFLILILLILGLDPEAARKVETIKNVIDRVSTGINNLKGNLNSLSADFQDIHLMLMGLNKPDSEGGSR